MAGMTSSPTPPGSPPVASLLVGALCVALASCAAPASRPVPTDGPAGGAPGPQGEADPRPLADWDGDGSPALVDCDDLDPAIGPGALETVGDGVDQDCDGGDDSTWVLGGAYEWQSPEQVRVLRSDGRPTLAIASEGYWSPDDAEPAAAVILWPLQTDGREPVAGLRTFVQVENPDVLLGTRVDLERLPDGATALAWTNRIVPFGPGAGGRNLYHAPAVWNGATLQWEVDPLDYELGSGAGAASLPNSLDSAVGEGGETWHVACRDQSVQAKSSGQPGEGATLAPSVNAPQGHPGGLCFWVEAPTAGEGRFANCLPQAPCEVVRYRPSELAIHRLQVVDDPVWTGRVVQAAQRRDGWLGWVEAGSGTLHLESEGEAHALTFGGEPVLAFDVAVGSDRAVVAAIVEGPSGPRLEVRVGDGLDSLGAIVPLRWPTAWTPEQVAVDLDASGLTVVAVAEDPTVVPAARVVWGSVAW